VDVLLVALICGLLLPIVVIWPLERCFPVNRDQQLWRTDSWIDVLYWLANPILRGILLLLAFVPAILLGLNPQSWFAQGFGPLAQQPAWAQVVEVVLLGDLMSYWVHRWFHGARLWKFHAVHHSSKQLDWLSTLRHHPVDDLALRAGEALPVVLLGFSPQAVAFYLPIMTFHAILSHANVKATFGPLGYLIVSPSFHRWHHTSQAEGMDRNFANLFTFWDVLFGTYYWPAEREAEAFGIHDATFPETSFAGQLLYPFKRGQ
jgi:sterol desaturase/sphingolipid hydroxylase (fatty acid hydroxylase superfamily)